MNEGKTKKSISALMIVVMAASVFALPLLEDDNYVVAASKITVKFKANGGSLIKQKQKDANGKTVKKKMTSKTVAAGKKYGTLAKAQRKGYKFKGWYTKEKGGKKITSKSKVNLRKDQTLYARWAPKTYKIKFNSMGGSAVKNKKIKYRKKYGTLPVPTKPGNVFIGWSTKKTTKAVSMVKKSTTYKKAGNRTLYAVWDQKLTLQNSAGLIGLTEAQARAYLPALGAGSVDAYGIKHAHMMYGHLEFSTLHDNGVYYVHAAEATAYQFLGLSTSINIDGLSALLGKSPERVGDNVQYHYKDNLYLLVEDSGLRPFSRLSNIKLINGDLM